MKVVALLWLMPLISWCQNPDPGDMLDKVADQLLVNADEEEGYEELYETLNQLLANPVDLNTVTREQLRAVMLLSESEINAFLQYRVQQGRLLDVLELQAVPGWSDETIRKIIPFVAVSNPHASIGRGLLLRIGREKNQYLVARYERTLEERPAYQHQTDSSQRYAGSPDRYYLRYRNARRNDFSIGFTAEKDAGEAFRWSPASSQYGFDFYSGHVQLMNKGILENLVMGDFQCQFGQGLQMGSAFGLGKTAQTITGIRRSNLGFMPYVSAGESIYLRGIAATARVARPIRLHLFGSVKHVDGTIEADSPFVTSIQTSGLHRTQRELSAKGRITDRDIGAALDIKLHSLDIGLLIQNKRRSHSVSPGANTYNQFQFRGHGFTNAGGYLTFTWSGVTCFAEYAHTLGHGNAMTVGVLGNFTSKLELAWLYRNFSRDYYSAYANPVSENSTPQNEQGLYAGIKYSFSRKLVLQGYLDYFRFGWLRYRVYKPSDGAEALIRIDYSPRRDVRFFLQAKQEVKDRNKADNQNLYNVIPGTKSSVWISGEIDVAQTLSIRSRIQGSQYEMGGQVTQGVAAIQEGTWKLNRWSLTARYALFDTDDYENRQYVYEKDVWLATSLPAYDGKGIRHYLLIHFAATRSIDFWFRWALTSYHDRDEIGNGLERIAGNERNDVKFQVRIRP